MTCPEWHRMLDEALDAEALDAHAVGCPDCSAGLAEQRLFLSALPLPAEQPPPGFARRVAAAVLRDRPARWRRAVPYAAAALAASLLVVLGLRLWPQPASPVPPVAETASPDLRGSVAEATTAVQEAASSTVQEAAKLLPPMGTLEPGPLPEPPSLTPLADAVGDVQAGLAPVTDSARRAVSLFFRDLPMGRDPG